MISKYPKAITLIHLLCLTLIQGQIAVAQDIATEDHLSLDFLRPQVAAGYSAVSARVFKDIDGAYDATSMSLQATIPVIDDGSGAEKGTTSHFLLARGRVSSINPELSFSPYSFSLYVSSIGFTGGIRTPSRHLYLVTMNARIAEDGKTIGKARIQPTGSLLGKYQLDDAFSFIYGLSYSYAFNRGLVVPVLGADCSLGRRFEMHLVLPYSLEVEYEDVESLRFGIVVRADGGQYHVDKDSYAGSITSPLYLKVSQIQAALDVSVKLGQHIWLYGEAGMMRNRNLAIGSLDQDLISSKIGNAGYSTVTLKYVIQDGSMWHW